MTVARLGMTRFLLLPAAALAIFSHHIYPERSIWDTMLGISGLLLLLIAMGGRIWASVYLTGRKNHTLITKGPYSLVRNPLYVFSLLGSLGAGLAFESVTIAFLFALIFFVTHLPTIEREEKKLEALFDDRYRRYRERVPRLIPALRRVSHDSTVTLDTRRFGRALRDCLAIPLVFVVAELLEFAKLSGVIPILLEIP